MAILEANTDLDVKGRLLATDVPNSTGSIVTWNTNTNVFGLRTDTQIISDLGLSSVVSNSHTHTNKLILDGITSTKVSNWNTAFGWGNHALAGYLTSTDLNGYATESWVNSNFDNYQSWNLKTNNTQRTTIQSGGTLDLVAGTNVSIGYSAGGVVTINSTDTNTTYSAGTLALLQAGTNTSNRVWSAKILTDFTDGKYLPLTGGTISGKVILAPTTDAIIEKTTPNGSLSNVIHSISTSASGGGRAPIRYSNPLGMDKGLGFSGNGDLIVGDWSDIGSLSTSWDIIWHEGNFNPAQYVPYTGANQPINFNTQDFTTGGYTNRLHSYFERINLVSNVTGSSNNFKLLTNVASSGVGNTSSQVSDIIITLPITTTTNWQAEIDILQQGYRTTLNVGGYSTTNAQRTVSGVYGDISNIVEVKFGRVGDSTVLIIKRSSSTTNRLQVNISKFYYHHTNSVNLYNDKTKYKIEYINESELIDFTLNGVVVNSQFIRDSYLWNKGDFTQTDVDNWNTAFGWGNHALAGYLTSTDLNGYATETWVNSQGYLTSLPSHSISTHSDVNITTPSNGQVLKYDNGSWINVADETGDNNYVNSISFNTGTGVLTLGRQGLSNLTEDLDGRYSLTSHTHTTSDITNLSSYTGFDSRYYTETEVDNLLDDYSLTSHNHTLDSLSNVTITSNTSGEILKWNGSAWINNTLAQAGIASSSHTHANLSTGTGLTGSTYNGGTARTFAFDTTWGDNRYALDSHNHDGRYASSNKNYLPLSGDTFTTGDDLDTLKFTGILEYDTNVSNKPTTAGGALFSSARNTSNGFQIAGSVTADDEMFFRKLAGSNYGRWFRVASREWANSQFSLQNHTHSASDITSGTIAYARLPFSSTDVGNWDTAFDKTILSGVVTGTTSKTMTLTRQDGTTFDVTWSDTNTTYSAGTLALLQAGTNTSNRVWSAKILNDWLVGKDYVTADIINGLASETWVNDNFMNITHAANAITGTNISNWNTAFGWGDHSTQGYLTSNQTITLSGDVSGSGTTSISVTIESNAVEAGMLNNNIISGKTALTSGLASTDELMISDAGVIKRMDVSVLQTYMQSNLAFSNNSGTVTSVATGTGLTGGTITSTGTISLNASSISSLALADTSLQPGDNISELNNDVGYTTNVGTVTSVSGGTGLTGTVTSSGSISLSTTTISDIADGVTAFGWGNHASAGYLTSLPAHALEDHSNVQISSPSNGEVLAYSSGVWRNASLPGGSLTLQEVTDNGNVTTNSITVASLSTTKGNINMTNTSTNIIQSTTGQLTLRGQGNSGVLLHNSDDTTRISLSNSNEIMLKTANSIGSARLSTKNITFTRTFDFPNYEGDLAVVNPPVSNLTSDSNNTINVTNTPKIQWIANFSANRTLNLSQFKVGATVLVFIQNSNANNRTITIRASNTLTSFQNVTFYSGDYVNTVTNPQISGNTGLGVENGGKALAITCVASNTFSSVLLTT